MFTSCENSMLHFFRYLKNTLFFAVVQESLLKLPLDHFTTPSPPPTIELKAILKRTDIKHYLYRRHQEA